MRKIKEAEQTNEIMLMKDITLLDDDDVFDSDKNLMNLPTEVLYKILSYLPYQELGNMMLVSTLCKEITEDPLVWKNFQLLVDEDKVDNLVDIFDINRFARLESIKTGGGSCLSSSSLSSLFTVIKNKETIKILDLTNTDLGNVDPDLLSETINAMTEVNLDMNMFTFLQTDKIFSRMREKRRLKNLSVKYNTLAMVDPVLLGDCLASLTVLDLTNTYLTSTQVEAMFLAMTKITNLTKLTMVEIIVADIPQQLFANCVHKLKYLKMTNQNTYCLTQLQLLALLRDPSQSHIQQLCLEYVDLSFIPCQVVAHGINTRQKVIIRKSAMTVDQVKAVLEMIETETTLKELILDIPNQNKTDGKQISLIIKDILHKIPNIKIIYTFDQED